MLQEAIEKVCEVIVNVLQDTLQSIHTVDPSHPQIGNITAVQRMFIAIGKDAKTLSLFAGFSPPYMEAYQSIMLNHNFFIGYSNKEREVTVDVKWVDGTYILEKLLLLTGEAREKEVIANIWYGHRYEKKNHPVYSYAYTHTDLFKLFNEHVPPNAPLYFNGIPVDCYNFLISLCSKKLDSFSVDFSNGRIDCPKYNGKYDCVTAETSIGGYMGKVIIDVAIGLQNLQNFYKWLETHKKDLT